MEYFKTFEQLIPNDDYNDYLDKVNNHFNDIERSKEDLDWYIQTITDLNNKGGIIYRLVFLDNKADLDTSELGEHWCLSKDDLENFYETLKSHGEGEFPFLITAKIEPGIINIDHSIGSFCELPNEVEVNITKPPKTFKVSKYKRSWE